MFKRTSLVATSVILAATHGTQAEIMVSDIDAANGDQTADLVTELNKCTGGATVSIEGGKLKIADGGNAYAGLLRDMIGSGTSVTLQVGKDLDAVFVGAWDPPVRNVTEACDATKKTTGTQRLDISDIKAISTFPGLAGRTPWGAMIHEITEVFVGKRDNLLMKDAHIRGIDAENVSLLLEGKGQRPQDTVTIPPRPPAPRPGGGYTVFDPYFDVDLGPGWTAWELVGLPSQEGGPNQPTALLWGFFGEFTMPHDELVFDLPNIVLEGGSFVPIPEPSSLILLTLGVLGTCRRTSGRVAGAERSDAPVQ